jgi:peptidyl-tRNA hydrolase, PTH1 family
MRLVVGLGNPGRRYEGTRHNVGYLVLAEVGRRLGAAPPKAKFHGDLAEGVWEGQKVLLLGPTTFMNRSGTSVRAALDFFGLSAADLLVVCDDLNLPLGRLRVRAAGSSGGQKGLGDIIEKLQSEEFSRLRIGIGSPPDSWDAADYVLARFGRSELPEIELAVVRAADAVGDWVRQGVQYCMNRYNQERTL